MLHTHPVVVRMNMDWIMMAHGILQLVKIKSSIDVYHTFGTAYGELRENRRLVGVYHSYGSIQTHTRTVEV